MLKEFFCSPAKKRADTERMIMGEELTDLEINLAQQLLKKQQVHSLYLSDPS